MPRPALSSYVEHDDDAWAWAVYVPDEHDCDGSTLASGREPTHEAAEEAAAEALADIEHRADIQETEDDLRRWVLLGYP